MKSKISTIFLLTLLAAIAALVIGIRLRLLHLPLDRDEGEYAYAGWRMLHGGIPYLDYYNMKMPGVYGCYAFFFLLFGETVEAVRLALLLVNLANAALMFIIGKQIGGQRTGIYSAIIYLLFSFTIKFHSFSTNAEYFAVFFVLTGIILMVAAVKNIKLEIANRQSRFYRDCQLFFSGFMFGMAVLMKQPSFVFIFMAILFILIVSKTNKTGVWKSLQFLLSIAAGSLLPLFLTGILLWRLKAGPNFLFFTIDYAHQYISYIGWQDGFRFFRVALQAALECNLLLWILFPLSVFLLAFSSKSSSYRHAILIFFIFSFIAVSAGFYFRPHYFQYLVPSISLVEASAFVACENLWSRATPLRKTKNNRLQYLPPALLAIASFYFFYNQQYYFFSIKSEKFHSPLFTNAPIAGNFISQHSTAEAKVAIFGAEPEIWFYAKRTAASGYLYVYPFLEHQKFAGRMLKQFYDEIINSKPDILVYTSNSGTWFINAPVHRQIYDWYKAYRDKNFHRIGLIDMVNDSVTHYYLADGQHSKELLDTIQTVYYEDYIEIDERNQQ